MATRRTSPRKKGADPIPITVPRGRGAPTLGGGSEKDVGAGAEMRNKLGSSFADAHRADHSGEEDEDDDHLLPDLCTLLGTFNLQKRGEGTSSESLNKNNPRRTTQTPRPPSANKNPSTTQLSPNRDVTTITPRARAMPTSSNLFLDALPCLHPTRTITSTATTTTTTTTPTTTTSPAKRKEEGKAVRPRSRTADGLKASKPSSTSTGMTSNDSRTGSRCLKLTHMNSHHHHHLLLPLPPLLKSLELDSDDSDNKAANNNNTEDEDDEDVFHARPPSSAHRPAAPLVPPHRGPTSREATWMQLANARTARFVLKEAAACADDDEDEDEEDEDGFTDLSGFIVDDDDAEVSFVDSGSEALSGCGDDDGVVGKRKKKSTVGRRRRLVRGTKQRETDSRGGVSGGGLMGLSLEDDDDDDDDACQEGKRVGSSEDGLAAAAAITGMRLGDGDPETKYGRSPGRRGGEEEEVEVIDLTSSPVKPGVAPTSQHHHDENAILTRRSFLPSTDKQQRSPREQERPSSSTSSAAETDSKAILRFSPPRRRSPIKLNNNNKNSIKPPETPLLNPLSGTKPATKTLRPTTTPPHTPPKRPSSPTKLNSPRKPHNANPVPPLPCLLSPHKPHQPHQPQIPPSPHRPSLDAFWSSEATNQWNDQHSPLKAPMPLSPKKKQQQQQRYEEATTNRSESDSGNDSGNDSPSGSPRERATRRRRRNFEAGKTMLARRLLAELDERVSGGELARLAAPTGGVAIVWSASLRSTAGRANWRRTIITTATAVGNKKSTAGSGSGSGSPVQCGDGGGGGEVEVRHYASIELADKVVDSEARLVNTLAHEYCHLVNFMVSGVRDRPHGESFKQWAQKVTAAFSTHPNPLYRTVEVTTKHSYQIEYKYLWVCVGPPPSNAAKDFLNLPSDADGCGAEYGRHSKSIDPEKQRCGKCRGGLKQLRPLMSRKTTLVKTRKGGGSPFKKKKKDGVGVEGLEKAMEIVTLDED